MRFFYFAAESRLHWCELEAKTNHNSALGYTAIFDMTKIKAFRSLDIHQLLHQYYALIDQL